MASSAGCYTRVTNSTLREWDCTAICGALNEDGECSEVSGCIDMGNGMVNGAEGGRLGGRYGEEVFVVVMILLVIGGGMLL